MATDDSNPFLFEENEEVNGGKNPFDDTGDSFTYDISHNGGKAPEDLNAGGETEYFKPTLQVILIFFMTS